MPPGAAGWTARSWPRDLRTWYHSDSVTDMSQATTAQIDAKLQARKVYDATKITMERLTTLLAESSRVRASQQHHPLVPDAVYEGIIACLEAAQEAHAAANEADIAAYERLGEAPF
jgi:hypothetical protein